MAEQEWIRAETPVEPGGTAWAGRADGGRFALRPLSLGEVLDRTFAVYRSRFWLFAGISVVAAAVQTVGRGVSLATMQRMALAAPAGRGAGGLHAAMLSLRASGVAQLPTYVVLLVFFLVTAVTQAATAQALRQVYLGRPASVKLALGEVAPRWARWIGIALWQIGSMIWVPLAVMAPAVVLMGYGAGNGNTGLVAIGGILMVLGVLAGFPVGFILYLRNVLATPAAVTEGLGIRAAMRRSKVLSAGAKGRAFVVLLIAGCLLEVAAMLQAPVGILMMMAPHQQHYLARGIALLLTFVGHTVVAPVALIGLTLVYFDQRVRKEALDLELLLEDARGVGTVEGYGPGL